LARKLRDLIGIVVFQTGWRRRLESEVEIQGALGTGSGALHNVEINHGGFDRGVAHQVLDGADVGT